MATITNNVMTFDGHLQHKRGTSAALDKSDYVPYAGEIIIATDTGRIKAGDGTRTWSELPAYDETVIANSYDEETAGKALDAVKGKDLNDRIAAFEGISGIDCGDWRDKWFITQNKPCMLTFDGSVDYYLDPHDYSKKEDGSDSDVSNTAYEGNAMAQLPLCWVKRYEEDGYEYEIVSDVQFDDDYKAYAHTRADGTIAEFFYWSMFGASWDATKLRSLSGQGLIQNWTTENQIAGATANGSNWYIHSWSQHELIRTLLVLLGKSTDTQAVFGWGNCRAVDLGRGLFNTGTLNDKGQFFGYNSNSLQVKVFHIEKFWGDQWDRTAGLISKYGSIFVKMTPANEGYSINDVNGYTDTGISLTGASGGYISEGSMSEFGFIPTIFCGSDATYYCDLTEFNAGLLAYLSTGGSAGTSSAQGGAFALSMGSSPSFGHGNIGCGLSCMQPATASSKKESDNP